MRPNLTTLTHMVFGLVGASVGVILNYRFGLGNAGENQAMRN
jgi:uncharacterized membrane protein YeaQ/YmgE (transglycosylase-associated protein family)